MKLVFSHFILLNLNSSFFLLQKKKKKEIKLNLKTEIFILQHI